MTCILPPSFSKESLISLPPTSGSTVYLPFLFATLLLAFHDQPCSPSRYAHPICSYSLFKPSPRLGYRFLLYVSSPLDRLCYALWCPVFLLSLFDRFFFFAFIIFPTHPFLSPLTTILHDPFTKTKTMRRLFLPTPIIFSRQV